MQKTPLELFFDNLEYSHYPNILFQVETLILLSMVVENRVVPLLDDVIQVAKIVKEANRIFLRDQVCTFLLFDLNFNGWNCQGGKNCLFAIKQIEKNLIRSSKGSNKQRCKLILLINLKKIKKYLLKQKTSQKSISNVKCKIILKLLKRN